MATSDLNLAKKLDADVENRDSILLSTAMFHLQLCVEKALKAFLIFQKRPPIKTHDLPGLLEDCSKLDPEFAAFRKEVALLNPYSTGGRYPEDEENEPENSEVKIAIRNAEQILEFVEEKIL